MTNAGTHVFRVTLMPKVYRDVEIQSAKTLYQLAGAIVRAFNFDFDHPFGFYSLMKGNIFKSPVKYELFADIGEDSDAGSVTRTRVYDAFPSIGDRMTFLFDYGDNWQFQVSVTAMSRKQRGAKYPRVVKEVGTAPEQYPQEGVD